MRKKFLCVCDGGNVRSHAMAFILKHEHSHEAIAVGRLTASRETLGMLCEWADEIILMQPCMEASIENRFKEKLRCVDVGPDRYGIYIHPELLAQVRAGAKWLTNQELLVKV